MGGSVGLKGTDGGMYGRALAMGARPVSPERTREFLAHVQFAAASQWLAAPGPMGADCLSDAGIDCKVVGAIGDQSAAEDTKAIARAMSDRGADVIVFAGGDGTARDMADAIDARLPVVAIPAGVKVYSSVFAYSARAAAELLLAFVEGADVAEEEVLDIDEDAFRNGRVDSKHYGYLLVPVVERLIQAGKESSGTGGSVAEAKQEIAAVIVDEMEPGILYLLGSGTTIRAIGDQLGIDKTLLGIDAVCDGIAVGFDLNERGILALLDNYPRATIVVTPLGGNGFIFGRGNKQFTPEVLRRVGLDNVIVVANRDKLLTLDCLRVDTGDTDLDAELAGYFDVTVGLNYRKVMQVQ